MTTFKVTSGLIAVKSDSGLGIFHIHSHRCLPQVRPYGNRELLALSIQKKKKKKKDIQHSDSWYLVLPSATSLSLKAVRSKECKQQQRAAKA